jgi:hypothetical protein
MTVSLPVGSVLGGELLFHHSRELRHVPFGIVRQARVSTILPRSQRPPTSPLDDPWYEAKLAWEPAYDWLAERLGFYPLFLAVGSTDDDRRMTGYQDQWRQLLGYGPEGRVYRRRGQISSRCLFSWSRMPTDLVFLDFGYWHVILNAVSSDLERAEARVLLQPWFDERSLFRRSWATSDWLRRARRDGGVQAVAQELDLRTSDEVWCRNREARNRLLLQGFAAERVRVRRLALNENAF